MQFSNIFALALAAMATASPTKGKSGSGSSSGSAPSCPAGQSAKCCSSMQKELLNLIPVTVGIGCVDLLSATCSQQTACCSQQNNGISVIQVCQLL